MHVTLIQTPGCWVTFQNIHGVFRLLQIKGVEFFAHDLQTLIRDKRYYDFKTNLVYLGHEIARRGQKRKHKAYLLPFFCFR